METEEKPSAIKSWLLATRPKTLTGAIVPVAIALALAWHDLPDMIYYGGYHGINIMMKGAPFMWAPAILCLLFACLMQIDANLINDYYDCVRGIDGEDRLGPERACSQGWISLPAMKMALVIVTVLSALVGLPLILWGGWPMVLIGLACIVFCYLYTTLLSGKAMGDILVIIFFGLVPVCATYYLQTKSVTTECWLVALGCGLATENLLLVNNFRDRDTDKKHGKTTLVTLIGERATLVLYLLCIIAAEALAQTAFHPTDKLWAQIASLLYLPIAFVAWQQMRSIRKGRALNKVLGITALSILVYGITVCIGILY